MIDWMKRHWILTMVFFVASVAMAAKITENNLKIGQPGSSGDKVIEFDVGDGANNPTIVVDNTNKDFDFNAAMNIAGDLLKIGDGTNTTKEVVFDIGAGVNNPRFRWNATFNTLEFSTDGTAYKKIGSGSGGASGVNVIGENNFDFETGAPPTDWTASGGTFVAETAAPLFGAASGSWNSNALNQTLDSVLAPITSGFLGKTCQAAIEYKYASGTAGDYQLIARQFDDSGATEIDVAILDLEVTGTSTRPAILFFDCPDDDADTLRIRIQSKVADAGIILVDDAFIGTGRTNTLGVAARQQSISLSGSGNFTGGSVLVTRSGDIVTLQIQSTLTFPSAAGATSAAGALPVWARPNDLIRNVYRSQSQHEQVFVDETGVIGFNFRDFAGGTVNLTSISEFGSIAYAVSDGGSTNEALTLDTTGSKLEAGFGADCSWSRSNAALGDFAADASCSFFPSTNGGFSNLQAQAGVLPGVTFNSSRNTTAYVCGHYSFNLSGAAADTVDISLLHVEPNYFVGYETWRLATEINRRASGQVCGFIDVQAGTNTVKFQARSSAANAVNLSGGSAIDGQIAIKIFEISNQFPTPIFTDLQNTLNTKVETAGTTSDGTIIFGGFFSNSGSPIFQREYGDYVDSLTDNGVGDVTINFEPGKIANFACTCSSRSANTVCIVTSTGSVGTQVQVLTYLGNTAASVDRDVHWTCVGRKQ